MPVGTLAFLLLACGVVDAEAMAQLEQRLAHDLLKVGMMKSNHFNVHKKLPITTVTACN